MERLGFLVLMLWLIVGFIVPITNRSAFAAESDARRIATAVAEDEHGDYEDYNEEAGGDVYSHSEYEEDVDPSHEMNILLRKPTSVEEPPRRFRLPALCGCC